MKAFSLRRPSSGFDRVIYLTALAVLAIGLPGCVELTSKAKGKASNLVCEKSARFINNDMDAGIDVAITVKNVGETGIIVVTPKITTSEGEWSRRQELQFNAGESKNLTYFFAEPTINATNIQCTVGVLPNAGDSAPNNSLSPARQ
jgi:hypothetical protein